MTSASFPVVVVPLVLRLVMLCAKEASSFKSSASAKSKRLLKRRSKILTERSQNAEMIFVLLSASLADDADAEEVIMVFEKI